MPGLFDGQDPGIAKQVDGFAENEPLKGGAGPSGANELGAVGGLHEFLDLLGERLESAGLRAVPGEAHTWRRPGFDLDLKGS